MISRHSVPFTTFTNSINNATHSFMSISCLTYKTRIQIIMTQIYL